MKSFFHTRRERKMQRFKSARSAFYGLLLLENSSVREQLDQKRTPPVMEPLYSDAACPILLGPP